jgi:di/tricarboxylate transporter
MAFAGAIVLGGLGVVPLPIAMMLGAVATILLGAIRTEEAYRFVDWRLLVLIGGMTAFGTAMSKTGAADFLAGYVTEFLSPLGSIGVSNAAAALVVLPVALEAAHDLGANPRTFAVTVMLAASVSFLTPFEPACLLVYGPGKYRFLDFVKVGAGMTVLLALLVLWMIPRLWPLGL